MKLVHLLIILVLVFGISGCTESGPKACSTEAKVCLDGSLVGRNPSNNCEFDPCPSLQPCDAKTPCEKGECYKFQDFERPICWEGTNPCERCEDGKCRILESYPAQIVCGEPIAPNTPPNETSAPETPINQTDPPAQPPPPPVVNNSCSPDELPDNCHYRLATTRQDGSFCGKINATNNRDACYYVVAYRNKDQSLCPKITDALIREQCEHLFFRP